MQGQRPARALQHYTSNFVLVNFAGTDGALRIARKGSGAAGPTQAAMDRSHPGRSSERMRRTAASSWGRFWRTTSQTMSRLTVSIRGSADSGMP